jgi:hypothetical protein
MESYLNNIPQNVASKVSFSPGGITLDFAFRLRLSANTFACLYV